jgi:uncharacterized OB-fold protein
MVSAPHRQRPVAEGLFDWPSDDPGLIGSACRLCDTVIFPQQSSCPRCTAEDTAARLLPRRGTLWTFTVQGFLPKSPPYAGTETPATFVPYGVGYVDLGDVKVEARLTEADATKLRIGMEMELVVLPFAADVDGTEIMTFAFRPAAAPGGDD